MNWRGVSGTDKKGWQGSDTDLDLGAGHMDLLVTFVKTR